MNFFTKKEVADLTGLTVRQLDYWGKDQLDIVPNKIGITVVYTTEQVIELMIASHLKKQHFVTSFIAGFLYAYRFLKDQISDEISLKPIYSISLNEYMSSDEIKEKIGYVMVYDLKSRIVTNHLGHVEYVFLTKDEILKFMHQILDLKKMTIEEIELPTLQDWIKELQIKAKKLGIAPEKISA